MQRLTAAGEDQPVLLSMTIEIVGANPPTGRLQVGEDEEWRPFVGWLGLTRLVGELVDEAHAAGAAGG